MSHLPPGFGIPDGLLSFDHLMAMWVLIGFAVVILLVGALGLVRLRNRRAVRKPSPHAARAPATRHAPGRPPRPRHLRRVA